MLGRFLLLLPIAVGVLVSGCKNVEIKPQEPGALTRGLKRDSDEGMSGFYDSENSLLPENEFVNLPPAPVAKNWLKFKAQRSIKHETALDTGSITVGGDGITRYALLIRTPSGVDNVSYEGVRCATQEWKMYATGRDNGAWARVPAPVWRRIDQTGLNAVRYTLFIEYVCDRDGVVPRNGEAVVAKIRKSNDGMLSQRTP